MQNSSNTIVMKAKYSGRCMHCGKSFDVGDEFKWSKDQRTGYCVLCPTENKQQQQSTYRRDIANVIVKKNQASTYIIKDLADLFDGRFTIKYNLQGESKERHITFWITTRGKDHKYAGSRRIRLLQSKEYVDVAYIKKSGELYYLDTFFKNNFIPEVKKNVVLEAIKLFVTSEDKIQYGMYYAMLSRRCFRCNRVLTNPETLKLESKCGPICDKFMQSKAVSFEKNKEVETMTFKI